MIKVFGGQLSHIVDKDLSKMLRKTDFQWVMESAGNDEVIGRGVYLTHRGTNNIQSGETVRVINFVDYQYEFDVYDAFGNIRYVPDSICREFFFDSRSAPLQIEDAFVEVIAS